MTFALQLVFCWSLLWMFNSFTHQHSLFSLPCRQWLQAKNKTVWSKRHSSLACVSLDSHSVRKLKCLLHIWKVFFICMQILFLLLFISICWMLLLVSAKDRSIFSAFEVNPLRKLTKTCFKWLCSRTYSNFHVQCTCVCAAILKISPLQICSGSIQMTVI